MTVFESLVLAHLLGDWILQTEWQAMNKGTSWRALLSHIAIYHVVLLAVLVARFGAADPVVYAVVAALVVLHILLDRRRPLFWFMRVMRITVTRDPEGWFTIAVDQSIHLLALGLAAIVLTRG